MGLFFLVGMMYASWGVHVPTLKEKFHLNEAWLSVALFAVAGGSIAVLSRIGPWVRRVGNRTACTIGGLLMCGCTGLILFIPWFGLLLPLLALFGVGVALIDVAMNVEATAVEAALGRPILASLHGMYSVGGIAGASLGGFLLSLDVRPAVHLAVSGIAGMAFVLIMRPFLLPAPARTSVPDGHSKPETMHHQASRGVWALGITALIALIAEGAMYDWLTVYMREILAASQSLTSAVYAVFAMGMAIGRFSGDYIRARTGETVLLTISGVLASVAVVAGLLLHHAGAALVCFTVAGLGFANMMPILTFAAARLEGIHAAQGIARVAGMAYVGLLIGPVLIGATAQATTLPIGLSLVAVCAALVAVASPCVLGKKSVH